MKCARPSVCRHSTFRIRCRVRENQPVNSRESSVDLTSLYSEIEYSPRDRVLSTGTCVDRGVRSRPLSVLLLTEGRGAVL